MAGYELRTGSDTATGHPLIAGCRTVAEPARQNTRSRPPKGAERAVRGVLAAPASAAARLEGAEFAVRRLLSGPKEGVEGVESSSRSSGTTPRLSHRDKERGFGASPAEARSATRSRLASLGPPAAYRGGTSRVSESTRRAAWVLTHSSALGADTPRQVPCPLQRLSCRGLKS